MREQKLTKLIMICTKCMQQIADALMLYIQGASFSFFYFLMLIVVVVTSEFRAYVY